MVKTIFAQIFILNMLTNGFKKQNQYECLITLSKITFGFCLILASGKTDDTKSLKKIIIFVCTAKDTIPKNY